MSSNHKTPPRFTENKQVVRDLQCNIIKKYFNDRLGNLSYLGLCSPEMKDVLDWVPLFASITAVERGLSGQEYRDQHHLLLTAARARVLEKLILLRGDIDTVLLNGHDDFGKPVSFPYDVISLDYSGGLFYRENEGEFKRLKAIQISIEKQAIYNTPFLLFISCNLDAIDEGEIRLTIENIRTELDRYGWNGQELCNAYLIHSNPVARLRLYVPYFVNQVAAKVHLTCQTEKTISYCGNQGIEMLNFRFCFRPDTRTMVPRFPQERLSQIVNAPLLRIKNGRQSDETLNLPKLRIPESIQAGNNKVTHRKGGG